MAAVLPLVGEQVALLAPLVKAAAAGAAEGGGGRQVVAAAVASALRVGASLLAPRLASEVDEEVAAREQLGRPHLTEMVRAGREGVVARPSGASRAFRGWAQHADFGAGPQAAPTTAAEARRRARGRRRRAGDAASAPTTDGLEDEKEELQVKVSVHPGARPMGELMKKDFKCAPGCQATLEVKAVGSAIDELVLENTRLLKGETKRDSDKLGVKDSMEKRLPLTVSAAKQMVLDAACAVKMLEHQLTQARSAHEAACVEVLGAGFAPSQLFDNGWAGP
ncbi:unnamed protein product [Prorocentrum cordatum]|uniref:Uncharacterized protein n=1 Tax=Prorocentrum cordatum TaxID=2364126 RepID=A0ABN9T3X0_9DINO|nr:unnamed protein product [Polarella glacialis]